MNGVWVQTIHAIPGFVKTECAPLRIEKELEKESHGKCCEAAVFARPTTRDIDGLFFQGSWETPMEDVRIFKNFL